MRPFLAALTAISIVFSAEAARAPGKRLCGTKTPPRALAKNPATPVEPGPVASALDFPSIDRRYSFGKKAALMIRISFPDAPHPLSDAEVAAINDTVNIMYRDMSRNACEFEFKPFPEVIQAPNEAAYYGRNFDALESLIESKVRAAGWIKGGTGTKRYAVYVASFPEIGVDWMGLSGGPGDGSNFINGNYNAGVTVHELGHAIGLPHAHSIAAGRDIFGTPGNDNQHDEYGNLYDIMGDGWPIHTHFNVQFKWKVGWMDSSEALEVKRTGTYRLYSMDNGAHKDRLLALRIPSTDTRYAYWIEYRAANPRARGGATVMFEGFYGRDEDNALHLLDMTPGSRDEDDMLDAVLAPGKSLKDKYGTATFKVLTVNQGIWNENGWVDVEVTIPGSIPVAIARPEPSARRKLARPGIPGRAYTLTGRALRP